MARDTKYRFYPTVRRGYRPSTPFSKSDATKDDALSTSGGTTIAYTAKVEAGPDAGKQKGTADGSVDLSMYGPAHISGIDSGQVVRMEPEPDSSTTPPNYFPFVEFETPDLPWLFSPVKADSHGRSYPWLRLIAVPKERASVSAAGGRPNPVLELQSPKKDLPPPAEAWAWAHAQLTGDEKPGKAFSSRSNATVSRLLSPRNLDPSTSYIAAVIPTFEAGRKVGLGEDPPSQNDAQNPKLALAWGGGSHPKRHPVYHHWEFSTSEKGDFEYLVRQLEAADLASHEYAIGYREIDVTDPGPETLDFEDGMTHTAKLGGALQATKCDDWWWYERSDPLRKLLNEPATAVGATDGYEVIGPPIYGRWHSQEIFERSTNAGGFLDLTTGDGFDWSSVSTAGMQWCDSDAGGDTVPTAVKSYDGYGPLKPKLGPSHHGEADLQWLYDLNLTPGFRIAASVGAGVVKEQQENLMAAAWDQVGEVREANRRLAAAQLSHDAMVGTVERMGTQGYPTERLLQVTEPAHERIYLDSRGRTVAAHLAGTSLREGVLSPAFRRLTSPAGRLSQRLEGDASGAGIVSGLLDDTLDTSIDTGPAGMVGVDSPDGGIARLCADARTPDQEVPQDEAAPWQQPPPEQRDRQDKNRGATEFQPPANSAVDRLRKLRTRTMDLLGTLSRIRTIMTGGEPTSTRVNQVRRLANDAVGMWHSLDTTVMNTGGLLASVSSNRTTLPNVDTGFDHATLVHLYGDFAVSPPTYGDMTRPFQEPFLPSVSGSIIWPGGLRSFSGPALREALELTRLPPLPRDAPMTARDAALLGDSDDNDEDTDTSTDGGGPDASTDGGDPQGTIHTTATPTYPVSLAEVRNAIDSVETVQAAIDDVLGYFGEGGSDAAYLVRLFCERAYATPEELPGPDATAVAESWTPLESFVDRTLERLGVPGLRQRSEPLDTIMAYPEFDQPMYRDLKDVSEEYILPGADEVPDDAVGALVTNRRFIEAYMVGLNHEMGSELLWRNYPTDRRGSYFKRFWDQRSRIPKPDDEDKLDDVIPLHRWDDKGQNNVGPSPLGSNVRTGETDTGSPPDDRAFGGNTPDPDSVSPTVVLLIRSELLRRYPNTTIYAAKAEASSGRAPAWASAETKASNTDTARQKFPIFRGRLEPDITFLGFDLTVNEALYAPYTKQEVRNRSKRMNDQGWFFVLSEPPGETKFGLDVGQKGETKPPFGVAKTHGNSPANQATEKEVEQGVEAGWAGLSWKHLSSGGGTPTHVEVDSQPPGTGSDAWTVEKGTVWAKKGAWEGGGDKDTKSEFTFGPEDAATWGKNSAHMAFITWQKPVRVAIHASDILPGGDP